MPKNMEEILKDFENIEAKTGTKKPRKKGVNGKKKGNRNERFFADKLSERFDKAFKRAPMSGAWGTIHKDTDLEDAKDVLSGDLICPRGFKFSIEVKSRQEFNFWDMLNDDTKNLEIDEFIDQASGDAERVGKEPMLLIKIDRRKPFALVPKELYGECSLIYKGYAVVRFDYLMSKPDDFFFV